MSYCLLDNDVAQLCCAIRSGDISDIQLLVEAGVDINSADKNGETALHVAAYKHNRHILQELLEAGANVNVQNKNGQTPLHIAASRGYDHIAFMLLDENADTALKTLELYSCILLLTDGHADTALKSLFTEMTALHMASQNGHTWVVKLLLEAGADIELLDVINKPAEFYAANEDITDLFKDLRAKIEQDKMSAPEFKREKSPPPEKKRIHHKIKYSQHHKKIMKLNVFDRLTRRKSHVKT